MQHWYPSEWVVRTILGSYPDKVEIQSGSVGRLAIDVGCGDGRNIPLLANAGYSVLAIDTSTEILSTAQSRCVANGIKADFAVAASSMVPLTNSQAHLSLCSSSLYYCDERFEFGRNVEEQARVLRPNGYLVANFPDWDHFLYQDAQSLNEGQYARITRDPHGIRNDTIHRVINSDEELRSVLGKYFLPLSIGHLDENYFGYRLSMRIVVAQKSSSGYVSSHKISSLETPNPPAPKSFPQ